MADQKTQNLPPIWKKPLDSAIHVKVYKNGDENFPGKTVTVNKRQQRTFDSWLGELSRCMKLRTGAVWRVFTPTQGHRVDDFDHLEEGKMVVVAGQEKFKPLRYAQIDPNPKRTQPRNNDLPEPNRRYQVSGKYRKVDTQATIIKCWANGNDTTGPKTVLLPANRNRPETLEGVLEQVSGVLCHDCCGPVEKLYLPNGIKVMSLDQITPNGHFVALRRQDRFKPAHYKETSLPNLRCSPRLERRSMLPPLSRSNKTSSHSSPEHSMTSHNGSENSYTQRYRRDRERARREEDQVMMARPVKYKRSSEKQRQADYDQDNGGVFKAKSQNNATRGARQVDDSRHTRTELPVDKRPAEVVQDEELEFYPQDDWSAGEDSQEDLKGKDKKDKRNRKPQDESSRGPPPQAEPQRAYRANAKQADSPSNEQARKEAEKEARARREAEDRARAEKSRQQQEAMRQKKKEKEEKKKKEEEERRKREQEEEERRKEEERERVRREEERRRREEAEEEERRRREEEEERFRREQEEEEERRRAAARTFTPDKFQNEDSPGVDQRSDSDMLREEQQKLAQEEEWAATKIQAGFRGYRDRRDMKQKQSLDDEDEGLEGRDSSLLRDEPLPVQGEDSEELSQQEREEQERAAIKIQATFRGAKARQEVRDLRANEEVKQQEDDTPPDNKSLTRTVSPNPQADEPPPLTNSNDEMAEHAAATKIQATFRGHQTRKELAAASAAQDVSGQGEDGGQSGGPDMAH